MRRFLNNLLCVCFLRAGHPCSHPGAAGACRGASPKGTFKPQCEALERREVMSATSGLLTAPPTSVHAIVGSLLANPGSTPQPTPSGSVSDIPFNGTTAVEVVSTSTATRLPKVTTVQSLNIKDQMITLFNQNLPSTTNAIIAYLSDAKHTGGHSLTNISLNLAPAWWPDSFLLSVDSAHDSFTLTYTQDAIVSPWASSLSCKVNAGPDTSMTVQFNLQLVMNFTTSGAPGNGPLALQSATMSFANANVSLSGFGVTTNDEVDAQVAFNHAQGDATATLANDLALPLAYLNGQLMSYAPQAVVTPYFGIGSAPFDLYVSSGSGNGTAPSAPALAQAGSPMSTPTTLVSSASPFSSQKPTDALVADTDVPVNHAMQQSLAGIGQGAGVVSSKAGTDVSVSLDAIDAFVYFPE